MLDYNFWYKLIEYTSVNWKGCFTDNEKKQYTQDLLSDWKWSIKEGNLSDALKRILKQLKEDYKESPDKEIEYFIKTITDESKKEGIIMASISRVEIVNAMDKMCRCVNDERWVYYWFQNGVADGDANSIDTLIEYCNDETFGELMSCFLKIMRKASEDGLYYDGVLSKSLKEVWK